MTSALWAVVGATGTGKTELSLRLVERLRERGRDAEIVNADAMQLYRGMNIGTAKLPAAERRGIPHHQLDVLEPSEEATVAAYQREARATCRGIWARGADAVLVGGSGLYVSSVLFDFRFPSHDAAIRAELEQWCDDEGVEPLLAELEDAAPGVAAAIDRRNPRRVVRALEVLRLGEDPYALLPRAPRPWVENTRIVGIEVARDELVSRLDRRVEGMWAEGLVDEVRGLIPRGIRTGSTARQAIGYAQALAQIDGALDQTTALAETQRLTRRYARRQVSWFRRYRDVTWLPDTDPSPVVAGLVARRLER